MRRHQIKNKGVIASMNEYADSCNDFELPLARCAWLEPHNLSSPAPWAGHIPFAAWLMAATRPRTLVELGVYSGISYLAFCQAAVAYGVSLRAWGVDTWQGDEHAGHYGQRILDTLRAQHDAPYGAFSTLLQKTFDQALADIPDGSVDLLHIDGLHTYEAVRHDFESWQCKLSERAVVLFHDIEVRRDDFGVWRYWAEITQHYPSLSFAHSNGLGVLLVGPQAPAVLQELARDTRRWPAVRDAFAVLGERFELRAQRMHLDTVVADLQQELVKREEQLHASQTALMTRDAELVRRATQELQAERAQSRALRTEVQDMLASRSWRITAGLRWLGRQARRLRATPAGQALITQARRTRKALGYVMAGDWRALMQRVRHVNQQASQVRCLQKFDGQTGIACGILATPHTWFVAHAIQAALARAGMAAQIVQESQGDYPLDLYFVVCPQMFKRLPPGEKRIAFQMEQSVSSRWFTPDYLSMLENSLAVLDYARTNLANLAGYGIKYPNVFYAPIGGIADYVTWCGAEPVQADEECDVLFYGDVNVPRRRRLLDAIGRRFKLRVVGNAFGADMHRALAGAKVVVNLHYYEGALLETTRIYECLSLGKAVVSEVAVDQAEHAALESVVRFVPLDDEPALLAALEAALAEQNSEHGRANYAARCREVVAATQARFDFMLYRLLLAWRVIDYPTFVRLTKATQQLAPRISLSLPETTERREAFETVCPNDVVIFDGLRFTPGWVGAAMSYKYLAQMALRQGLPQLEIMEDDVEFAHDYHARHMQVQAYLAERHGQWDVFVGVMALVHPETRVLHVDRRDGQTYVTIDRMISMVGNIYAPTALQRIAQWDESNQDAQTNTIDRFLQMQGNMRVVIALPFLLGHREDVDSSLWGFSNERYAQMIAQAQTELEQKVAEFEYRAQRASHML